MLKLCIAINKKEELELNCDSIIIGLKNFNTLNVLELSIKEIEDIVNKYTNKEIFISINKNIHDYELDELKRILFKLNNINIKGIIFDDVGIYNIINNLNLNIKLIWGNMHQVTNYTTINEWNKLGVKSAITSPEITIKKICELQNNSNSILFIPIYGMFEIFNSNRFLLSNYLKYINNEKMDDKYYIKHNETNYPIFENETGTHIIDGKILNGINEIRNLNNERNDYLLINTYMLNNTEEVIKTIDNYINGNSNISSKLNENEYDGFLNKETFYKVKSSDNNERK